MQTKRVTVTEREYDSAGNIVKETETVTEYEDNSYKPWTVPYTPPYSPYIVTS